MGCGCGNSNCGGGCGNSSSIPLPIDCGARPCSPLADCRAASPGCPTPYYQNTPQCQENHCQQINNYVYNAGIKNDQAFNLPACGAGAVIYSDGLKTLAIGSYLWNPTYGYLKVTAFDYTTGQIVVVNLCNDGNAAVGTNIPACTPFLVTDTPQATSNPNFFPYLAIDFTAPANGDCLTITVTNVNGLVVGNQVTIGTGTYTLNSIVSPTSINICNNGLGITPGTPVIAKDVAGNYQYPIGLIAVNPCGNGVVASGVVLVCNGGGAKPLDGAAAGNLLTLIDPALNTAGFANPCSATPIASGSIMACNGAGGIAPILGNAVNNVLQVTGGNVAAFQDISCGDYKNSKVSRTTNASGSANIVDAAGGLHSLITTCTPAVLTNLSSCRSMQVVSVITYTIDFSLVTVEASNASLANYIAGDYYYAFTVSFYIDRGDGSGSTLIKTYTVSGMHHQAPGDIAASRLLRDFRSFTYEDLIPIAPGATFAFPIAQVVVTGLAPAPATGAQLDASALIRIATLGVAI